jgi:hypothetical protein
MIEQGNNKSDGIDTTMDTTRDITMGTVGDTTKGTYQSFINTNDSEKMNYYKNILKNYKLFSKYLTEGKSELYKNLKKYKKEFYFIHNYYKKEILIIDGENILKSFKFQPIFKNVLGKTDYYKYFNCWLCGYFNNANKSHNTFINPYTSLNMSYDDKKFILERFTEVFLNNYNNIFIISSNDVKSTGYINNHESIIIPINYDKCDIREQDDHLIVFLNKLLDYKYAKIISFDNFNWCKNVNILIFKIVYNYDNKTISIVLAKKGENDIKIINNISIIVNIPNYPYIDIKNVNSSNGPLGTTIYDTHTLVDTVIDSAYIQLKINNYNDYNDIIIKNKNISKLVNKYIKILLLNDSINKLYDWLKNIVHNKDNNNNSLDKICNINNAIENYKYIYKCYLILRAISILYYSHKLDYDFIIMLAQLYSNIIKIYEFIDTNYAKIRKIAIKNINNAINPEHDIFCFYLYLKKNGINRRTL